MLKSEVISMLYTVQQVADKLGVSKVTVYAKLKLTEFKDKTTIKDGKTYIDEELSKLIKNSISVKQEVKEAVKQEVKLKEIDRLDNDTTIDIAIDKDQLTVVSKAHLSALQDTIELLKQQLREKDIQIEKQFNELNDRLQQEQELHQNTQVLYKQEQEKPKQDLLLLEEHFREVDSKLMEVKGQLEQRQESQSKGFFKKFFKGE
jgi:hypothetical protein